MSRHKQDISRCAPARVLEETLRLLRIGHAENTLRLLEQTELLSFLLPEICAYLDRPTVDNGDNSRFTARDLFYRHLRALDTIVAERSVSDAVVLGALLYPSVTEVQAQADASKSDRIYATNHFLTAFGARLFLTRRTGEHLRQIFIAQRYFVQSSKALKRRRKPTNGARLALFRDALDLYETHARALDLPLEEVERWRGALSLSTRSLSEKGPSQGLRENPRSVPNGPRNDKDIVSLC